MSGLRGLWRRMVGHDTELPLEVSCEVGQPDIDEQHRYFVRLIRRLRNAIQQQVESDRLVLLLHELKKYAEFHFASEENLMHALRYPQRQEHGAIHAQMLSELSVRILKARQQWRDTQPLLNFLEEWLRDHIANEDRKLAEYIELTEPALARRNGSTAGAST